MRLFQKIFREETIYRTAFVFGAGTGLLLFGKETFLGEYYAKYLQKYKAKNEPVNVKLILDFQFKTVLQDLKFTKWNSQYLHLFINKKLDPVSFGSTETNCGVWVGVPEYYQETSEEGIINTNILIDGKPVKWDSADGKKFLNSLMLSNNATKFLIARELTLRHSYYAHFSSILPVIMFSFACISGEHLYKKLKLHHRPLALSLTVGSCALLVFSGFTLFLNDALYFFYDKVAEDEVSSMGVSYLDGGIEYYSKKIERNKALRNLMKKGHKYYSAEGNENNIWTAKGMPETVKLNILKEKLEQFVDLEEFRKIKPANPNPQPVI